MLKIENLTYKYDKTSYCYTLKAEKSQITAIVGESGSGKSTLLDLIAGFLTPMKGKIELENIDITNLPTNEKDLTILFQNYNLFEHLTVIKNLTLGIDKSLFPKKENIKKAKEMLKEVNLKGYENRISSTLSGGEQQRVALARALLREKKVLLLDEPFSALDYAIHQDMLKLVQKITKEKSLYTIMVTHDLRDCELVADVTYKVENGKIHLQKNRKDL